jgi:hypothetical protein
MFYYLRGNRGFNMWWHVLLLLLLGPLLAAMLLQRCPLQFVSLLLYSLQWDELPL